MTTKPSAWAVDVWRNADAAYRTTPFRDIMESDDVFADRRKAAAIIIEQARRAWEQELCEWLRGMNRDDTNWPQYIATAIEAGEHREGRS